MKILVRFAWPVAVAILLGSTIGVRAQNPPAWIPAWSTSQQLLGTKLMSNATVRMIGRVTIGGSAIRVRIDNTFGTVPLNIAKAAVGIPLATRSGDNASQGAALIPGSSRPLLFNGVPGVTIGPGGSAISDGVTMPVLARQDVAVSLYLPDANVRPSQHTIAQVRSYLTANGAGDETMDEAKTPFSQSTSSTFWLKSIEVLSSSSSGAIVAFGDSITDGTCTTFDAHDRWIDYLAERIDSTLGDAAKAVLNEGIGGDTLTQTGGLTTTAGTVRLDRDVLSHQGATDVILFMGTNDIKYGQTYAKIIAAMQDVITRTRGRGMRIFGATILPRQGSDWSSAKGQVRQQVNQWIRTQAPFDGVIDFDRVVRDPALPDWIAPAFNCDNVHPNPLGYYHMARSLNLDMLGQ